MLKEKAPKHSCPICSKILEQKENNYYCNSCKMYIGSIENFDKNWNQATQVMKEDGAMKNIKKQSPISFSSITLSYLFLVVLIWAGWQYGYKIYFVGIAQEAQLRKIEIAMIDNVRTSINSLNFDFIIPKLSLRGFYLTKEIPESVLNSLWPLGDHVLYYHNIHGVYMLISEKDFSTFEDIPSPDDDTNNWSTIAIIQLIDGSKAYIARNKFKAEVQSSVETTPNENAGKSTEGKNSILSEDQGTSEYTTVDMRFMSGKVFVHIIITNKEAEKRANVPSDSALYRFANTFIE